MSQRKRQRAVSASVGSAVLWALVAPTVGAQVTPAATPPSPNQKATEADRAAADRSVRANAAEVSRSTGVNVRVLAVDGAARHASGAQPPVGSGGEIYQVLPPSSLARAAAPAGVAAPPGGDYQWHSSQGGSGRAAANIAGSGGDGNRNVSVGYSQNTYRDVGVLNKTVMSDGVAQLLDLTGAGAAPLNGQIVDSEQCSGASVTAIIQYPSGPGITTAVNSNNMTATIPTNTSLNYAQFYTNAFRCQVSAQFPGKITRSNAGQMNWKNGGLSPNSTPTATLF